MAEDSCAWGDACDRSPSRVGLCKRHYQLATRRGVLDAFRHRDRRCSECGESLPPGAQTNRLFCSQRCANVTAYRHRDPVERREAHKTWRDLTAPARAAAALAAKPIRQCEECGMDLPREVGERRRFCNRKCINNRSLREKRELHYEHTRRRRARLRGVSVPGVTERDWRRMKARFGHRCAYCLRPRPLTMDHIIPLIRGGRHAVGNILPACGPCNSTKNRRLLIEWRRARPGLSAVLCR